MGAVSFFLVFLAILLIGVTILIGTDFASRVLRSRRAAVGGEVVDGFDDPVASLPPVLLPAHPQPSDVDHVRFALGLRGYRMDQVDQVLDELRDQLAEKDQEISRLRTALLSYAATHGEVPGEDS
jgi:DivIVA domain-containing protein